MGIFSKFQKRTSNWCSAVVVAAGISRRMQGVDKIMLDLEGVPLLARTLQPFQLSDSIQEIIVVTRQDLLEPVAELCQQYRLHKVSAVVTGGDTRSESVLCGLQSVDARCTHVAIHDGARPFVSQRIIAQTVEAAMQYGAAAPAIPVKDTIKLAEKSVVTATPERAQVYAVQTPQCFDADLILAALQKALDDGATLTDDCMAVERLGGKIHLTRGGTQNMKVTTQADLWMAAGIVRGRAAWCASATDTTSTD